MLLNDPALIRQKDTNQILLRIDALPEQLQSAWEEAQETPLPRLERHPEDTHLRGG
ncbi:MAG: hypothetical protein JXA13_15305 [Anaerolineales bacterium]|nr:hypothetical protein [Anaerolineales bacterium]